MTIRIVAYGAISPLGRGAAAVSAGNVGEGPRVASFASHTLAAAGLARPVAAAVEGFPVDETRAEALLAAALADVTRALDAARPSWRGERVGIAIGTSSGGMRAVEAMAQVKEGDPAERARLADQAMYFSPFVKALTAFDRSFAPATLLLGACASSTLAIGLGMRWLEEGACDVVLAGGFDAESVLVASGFEALRATTASPPPRPFRSSRDGLALGEGAAVVALARDDAHSTTSTVLLGFGASCDAVHVTAPDREGKGLARAAKLALADANVRGDAIDLVSAHGTATPFNDAAEALAIAEIAAQSTPVVHAYKSQIGHALGAAGALELLASIDALDRRLLPATAGGATHDSLVRLLPRGEAGDATHALKLSSAFGGLNAALVVGRSTTRKAASARARGRPVYLESAVYISPEDPLPALAEAKVGRLDIAARLALAAAFRLDTERGAGSLAALGAGIVVGHTVATFEVNTAYAERIAARGARSAEPRIFPYTSPNAGAGEAAIAFGLTGPAFAVGAGMHAGLEAVVVAASLVRAGDADAMVVVAVDAVGDASRAFRASRDLPAGAVAVLVTAMPSAFASDSSSSPTSRTTLRISRAELGFDRARARENPLHPGHLALRSLTSAGAEWNDKLSIRLESVCTSGAFASLTLDRV